MAEMFWLSELEKTKIPISKEPNKYCCTLCGTKFAYGLMGSQLLPGILGNSRVVPYLDRGLSKKEYICAKCYHAKIMIYHLEGSSEKREVARQYLSAMNNNQSSIIQDLLEGWINAIEHNPFSELNGLMYYVKGVYSSIFVFDDHITQLSDIKGHTKSDVGISDFIFKFSDPEIKDKDRNRQGEMFVFQPSYIQDDVQKVLANVRFEDKFLYKGPKRIGLEKGIKDCGYLSIGKQRFYYYSHQNYLMEEVYNFILQRMNEENVCEEDKNLSVQNGKEASYVYSPADELRKIKDLLDCGIITEKEFADIKEKIISKF